MSIEVQLPITKEMAKTFKVGDVLYLTGYVYTCRDAGHKLIAEALERGEDSPVDWTDQLVYYAGPCPAPPGKVFNSNGPTTAVRMDPYVEMMLKLGATAMLGKGVREPYIADLCKEYGAVSLLGVGGASAINAARIKSAEIMAYGELGTESIKKLYFDRFRVIVGIDTEGNVLQYQEIPKYKR